MEHTRTPATMTMLQLPDRHHQHWRDALEDRLQDASPGPIDLDCGDWLLTCSDLQQLNTIAADRGYTLRTLLGQRPETIVSASALGLDAHLRPHLTDEDTTTAPSPSTGEGVLFHHGTLRSGDHLQSDRDVLLYGDVNPGARISAAGHVLVWGRLRGIAHAGRDGDPSARIVALQLRPLQLRIGDVVARGPDDLPQEGLVEQARLEGSEIVIEAASAQMITRS